MKYNHIKPAGKVEKLIILLSLAGYARERKINEKGEKISRKKGKKITLRDKENIFFKEIEKR